jgi:hypothetical protein
LSSQECKNSPAEYCCLVPFYLFPFFFLPRGEVINRTVKSTLLFSPTPACRCSSVHTCMWNRGNWVLRATATSWPDLQCMTAQRPSSSSTLSCPRTLAPPSGLCMALCRPRPLLRSLEDTCNDHALRVSSPALTSNQPLEYKKKRKN